jgi:alpha-L-arabinofuranosidase
MKHFNLRRIIIVCMIFGAVNVCTALGSNTVKLSVDKATDTIQKEVYGGLLEDWGRDIYKGLFVGDTSSIPNTYGMRNDIIAGLKECKIGQLQWPGGCAAEIYTWTSGIGTRSERTGGQMTNGMGTYEYFQLCSLTNTIPYLEMNFKSGTALEAASSMAGWLRYIDANYPNLDIKYLGLGNEPWGGCNGWLISDTAYLNRYDTIADSVPLVHKNKLSRIVSAGSGANFNWDVMAIKRALGKAEGIAWHGYTIKSWTESERYTSVDYPDSEYYPVFSEAYSGVLSVLDMLIDTLNKYDTNNTMSLMPTEWGTWYQKIANESTTYQQSTVRDAQIAALHMNYFNNHCSRIKLAGIAQPVNALQSLFLTKRVQSSSLIKTPTFYVFKLFSVHQNSTMIPSDLSCGSVNGWPVINESASIDSNGVLHISLANIDKDSSQSITITISGTANKFIYASGQIINGPTVQSHNGFDSAENVNILGFDKSNYTLSDTILTVKLPAHSVVMMTLSKTPIGIINRSMSAATEGRYSIATVRGNSIVLAYMSDKAIPVRLSLFGVDGKRVVGTYNGILKPGQRSIVWQPKNIAMGTNIFVIKMDAGTISKSQRIMLTK